MRERLEEIARIIDPEAEGIKYDNSARWRLSLSKAQAILGLVEENSVSQSQPVTEHASGEAATSGGEPSAAWARWRKKPIEIDAYQFRVSMLEAHLFDGAPLPPGVKFGRATYHKDRRELTDWRVSVMTAHEQPVSLEDGDWIVPEPRPDRFYPIKPDIFAATYEVVAPLAAHLDAERPAEPREDPNPTSGKVKA